MNDRTLTQFCGPHCGIANNTVGHCKQCHAEAGLPGCERPGHGGAEDWRDRTAFDADARRPWADDSGREPPLPHALARPDEDGM